MPSVRFSRDKRGYEYVYLVHTATRRGKPGRTRVLYWYRTPPGMRIGRKPFDEEVRRTLEQQNPGVSFDWEAIISTPMPPPDMTEYWRERRRAEKVARQERRAMDADEVAEADSSQGSAPNAAAVEETTPNEQAPQDREYRPVDAAADAPPAEAQPGKKRRRRRGGRKRRGPSGDGTEQSAGSADAEPAGSNDANEPDDEDPSAADDPACEGE